MKLKSFFLLTCMMASFLACSDKDEPGELTKTPVVANAGFTLSMQTSDKVKTSELKADVDNTTGDGTIKTLAVVVFNANGSGAYAASGYKVGDIVATVTRTMSEPGNKAQISATGLAADQVDMLLIANAETELIASIENMLKVNSGTGHYNLTDVQALTTSLTNESDYNVSDPTKKGLTMTKLLKGITLNPNDNVIDKDGNAAISLVRTVAKVELNKLGLATPTSSSKFTSVRFDLKEVFVANVKGSSHIVGDNIEAALTGTDLSALYQVGDKAWTTNVGTYKTGTATYNETLQVLFPDGLSIDAGKSKEQAQLNSHFYVYANQNGERAAATKAPEVAENRNYTLLVVKGDYTHKVSGSDVVEKDRYYTVVVNDQAFDPGISGDHIQRNIKYWVNLTITGSGSDTPYDPAAYAHIAANVKVTPWSTIEVNEDVD